MQIPWVGGSLDGARLSLITVARYGVLCARQREFFQVVRALTGTRSIALHLVFVFAVETPWQSCLSPKEGSSLVNEPNIKHNTEAFPQDVETTAGSSHSINTVLKEEAVLNERRRAPPHAICSPRNFRIDQPGYNVVAI